MGIYSVAMFQKSPETSTVSRDLFFSAFADPVPAALRKPFRGWQSFPASVFAEPSDLQQSRCAYGCIACRGAFWYHSITKTRCGFFWDDHFSPHNCPAAIVWLFLCRAADERRSVHERILYEGARCTAADPVDVTAHGAFHAGQLAVQHC